MCLKNNHTGSFCSAIFQSNHVDIYRVQLSMITSGSTTIKELVFIMVLEEKHVYDAVGMSKKLKSYNAYPLLW